MVCLVYSMLLMSMMCVLLILNGSDVGLVWLCSFFFV